MCVSWLLGAKIWGDHLNKELWSVWSYSQRLSAVVNNNLDGFNGRSELQIIHAFLQNMESDGPAEVLIDWIIDHFLFAAMVVMGTFSYVWKKARHCSSVEVWRRCQKQFVCLKMVLSAKPTANLKKKYRLLNHQMERSPVSMVINVMINITTGEKQPSKRTRFWGVCVLMQHWKGLVMVNLYAIDLRHLHFRFHVVVFGEVI